MPAPELLMEFLKNALFFSGRTKSFLIRISGFHSKASGEFSSVPYQNSL
jgi:hypothetical protein